MTLVSIQWPKPVTQTLLFFPSLQFPLLSFLLSWYFSCLSLPRHRYCYRHCSHAHHCAAGVLQQSPNWPPLLFHNLLSTMNQELLFKTTVLSMLLPECESCLFLYAAFWLPVCFLFLGAAFTYAFAPSCSSSWSHFAMSPALAEGASCAPPRDYSMGQHPLLRSLGPGP